MSVIEELAAEIRRQCDEDELWATEASRERGHLIEGGAHWQWVHGDNWEPVTPDPSRGPDLTTNDGEYFCGTLISIETFPWSHGGSSPMYVTGAVTIQDIPTSAAGHLARHDPARVLAEVSSRRALVDALLAEPHLKVDDCWYDCSQARDVDGELTCVDPDRSGGPCDCGRDDRVRRYLELLLLPYRTETTK